MLCLWMTSFPTYELTYLHMKLLYNGGSKTSIPIRHGLHVADLQSRTILRQDMS